jgi:hypothetical protein
VRGVAGREPGLQRLPLEHDGFALLVVIPDPGYTFRKNRL